ncbi:50S ribosomal protein L9 [Fangia hongkongensis]|uniref:50S ribosomal protein L9 n=1 Tax=Fangia hongkongensis TaxID=270495 RepID=UPI00035DCB4C|nr:50S ribosomal protein L9 [Fangia hongkongensis]MBK2124508.1 50S ribosomal protein L9 [Fangia hongkongensis]
MQVILKEKVENLGALGDVVNVKPGYARNYLVPYGKAVQATEANIAAFDQQKAELQKVEAARLAEAKANAEKVEGQVFVIKAAAGDGGKLFGSVGTKEVAEVVAAQKGVAVEKRHVRMPEGIIRTIGEFTLSVHLHTDVDAEIKVVVEAE